MSQDWTDDVYDKDAFTAHVIMTNIELMFATLKSTFSGTSAPSNTVPGMLWLDTTGSAEALKMRNEDNDAWIILFDLANFGILADIISEQTGAAGVTIDGVLCKDNDVEVGASGEIRTDTIAEKTGAAGVTIDGVLCKDGELATADCVPTIAFADGSVTMPKLEEWIVGDYSLSDSYTAGNTGATSYIQVGSDVYMPRAGIIRTRIGLRTETGTHTAYGKVYKNGSPFGTERNTGSGSLVYWTEDLAVEIGDTLEIWVYTIYAPVKAYGTLSLYVGNPNEPIPASSI